MADYAERERRFGYINARFTLRAEDGRSKPIYDDYRCHWNIGNLEEDGTPTINGGPITLDGRDDLLPGETALVRIHPNSVTVLDPCRVGHDNRCAGGAQRGGLCRSARYPTVLTVKPAIRRQVLRAVRAKQVCRRQTVVEARD